MTFHVYILLCADGSYYVGQTSDLDERLATHQSGGGPTYTSARLPVQLVYSETFPSRAQAMTRESQLKKWSRAKKEALISGDGETLRRLSQSRD